MNKGAADRDDQITTGVKKAQEYCDLGVHIRDGHGRLLPTLSPREHDLLRRCMSLNESMGVDLEWWSAEDTSVDPNLPRWKKVLLGQFLLKNNMGRSNHVFFKFEPADDAPYVHAAAAVAAQKLRHVKRVHACSSSSRSILVTESVCASRPLSIDQFLAGDSSEVIPAIPQVVEDIVHQLDHLGTSTEMRKPLREVLWPYFQDELIQKAIKRWVEPQLAELGDINGTFQALKANATNIWISTRQCNHGDLHAKNVAIDVGVMPVRAFIFDTGSMSPALNVRDLALLEVTVLLFPEPADGASLVDACAHLYSDGVLATEDHDLTAGTSQAMNTTAFIAEIRRRATKLCDREVYALAVFDHALMELSGLAYQSSRNKIAIPTDAAKLAAISAAWLRRVAPSWFSD